MTIHNKNAENAEDNDVKTTRKTKQNKTGTEKKSLGLKMVSHFIDEYLKEFSYSGIKSGCHCLRFHRLETLPLPRY